MFFVIMIRNIFRTLLVLCITFGYWTTTDAATVNWSAFRFVTEDSEKVWEINKWSYDFAREELTLNFKLTTTRDPREDYILETEVWGKDCEMLLEYDSPYIIWECVLDINEADAKWMYEIDFEIIDEDDNTVYARNSYDIEIEWLEDDFDWDELQYEALYVMEDQDLLITLFLEDVVREPNHEYRVYIDLEWKEYNKNLSYSSSDEKLYVEFEIYINEDDIEKA